MADPAAIAEAEKVLERPYNADDPKQVNEARKRAGRRDRERLSVLGGLMDLKDGRAWMYSILEACHAFQPSFVPNDPYSTAFKEGERNIALRLLADIMAIAPDRYVDMMKEAKGHV